MFLTIADVLRSEECDAIQNILEEDVLWVNGGSTASGNARLVKNNLLANTQHASIKGVLK